MKAEKKKTTVIGLCGRSGSGKGYLCSVFAELGVPAIDTDAVYRALTSAPDGDVPRECTAALAREFGEEILAPELSLNRRALAQIVFAEGAQDKLKRLNEITHAYILSETDRIIESLAEDGASAVIVDAPVLFESGYNRKCDFILAAVAEDEVLLRRIMNRDGISAEAARARLAAQLTNEELSRRADFVIDTHADRAVLKARAEELLEKISPRMAKQ